MSYNLIYLQVVFVTKNRKRILTKSVRTALFIELRKYARSLGIKSSYVNGVEDHVHILFMFSANDKISTLIGQVKGYISHWIKNQFGDQLKTFQWCSGYYADGVSRRDADSVRMYIAKQEMHHRRPEYREAWEEVLEV